MSDDVIPDYELADLRARCVERRVGLNPRGAERALAHIARLHEALDAIAGVGTDLPHARRLDRDQMRAIALAAREGREWA